MRRSWRIWRTTKIFIESVLPKNKLAIVGGGHLGEKELFSIAAKKSYVEMSSDDIENIL